ncbi:flagellar hook-associated protein FlgK, partial [Acinetobacter sp. RIT592]
TQEVRRNEKNQSKVLKEIDNSRLNVSGVSLDEEMINLIQFQHAYNASAKVVSTIDSLLDVVINGLVR